MDGEHVGRRGIPSLPKPSSSSGHGGAGDQEHIAADITQVRSPTLSCHPIFLVLISFLLLFVAAASGTISSAHRMHTIDRAEANHRQGWG